MRKILLFIALLCQLPASADQPEALMAMTTARLAGSCETVDALIAFQASARLPGGDEFVLKFMNAEMMRLGLSMNTFASVCAQSLERYEIMWKSIEEASRLN